MTALLNEAPPGPRQFAIGACLGTSLRIYGRNLIPFAALGFILHLPVLLLTYYTAIHAADITIGSHSYYLNLFYASALNLVVSSLVSASVIYGSFQDLRGSRAGIGDCIVRGLSSAFPVIIASILATMTISVASLLFVVPGIVVYLTIWVYIPAIVVEGEGIANSFSRSSALTSGRRWHILGLTLIILVGGLIFGAVLGGLIGLVVGLTVGSSGAFATTLATLAAQYVVRSLVSVFGAITTAVGYYLLRAEKEGVEIDEIAKVFD